MCKNYSKNSHPRISFKINTGTQVLRFRISWPLFIFSVLPYYDVRTLRILETGGGGKTSKTGFC